MPELPQLIPVNAEKQQLYFELPPDDGAPHPISKAVASRRTQRFRGMKPGFEPTSYRTNPYHLSHLSPSLDLDHVLQPDRAPKHKIKIITKVWVSPISGRALTRFRGMLET
ncbi:hypothetical protein ILYODFUR_020566 [Ilyodon furcidens]|uniref:Uncharacterized protein n=1 Tax=Ilyodon furcidens TaxID=33524 RepID=A0ABV0VH61_9TELE